METAVDANLLVELGLPSQDAQLLVRTIAKHYAHKQDIERKQSIAARQLVPGYWRKLIELGVPLDEARTIAVAIAWFDISRKPLTPEQKALVGRNCVKICRAELWRPGMLLL